MALLPGTELSGPRQPCPGLHGQQRPGRRPKTACNAIPAAVLHPMISHAPRLADVVNMVMLAAAAGGSGLLATAKYVYESGQRRAEQDAIPTPPQLLHGVDVAGSKFLGRPRVLAAADFAARAHEGQRRRTGEPYITHCVHAAAIVEGLLAQSRKQEADERAETAIVAALLHDTVDDTDVTLNEVREAFGEQVANCVDAVSRLSEVNQMIRRNLRQQAHREEPSAAQRLPPQEGEALRHFMVCLTDEPVVLAVKLADRLHNMRTCHALAPDRRAAVASETLEVWCSLAEQLGMFPLKAELEDLCFAVLQPEAYGSLRRQLDALWGVPCTLPALAACPPSTPPMAVPKQPAVPMPSAGSAAGKQAPAAGLTPEDQHSWELGPFVHSCHAVYIDEAEAARPARDGSATASTSSSSRSSSGRRSSSSGGGSLVMSDDEAWAQVRTLLRSRKELRLMQRRITLASGQVDAPASSRFPPMLKPRRALRSKYEVRSGAGQRHPLPGQLAPVTGSLGPSSVAPLVRSALATLQPARGSGLTSEQQELKQLLGSVAPFQSTVFKLPVGALPGPHSPALAPLIYAAHALRQELGLSHAVVGLNVEIEARLKSLYSTHRKMQRKGIPVQEVYDTRAMRIIVDDARGSQLADAVEACYAALPVVHRLWREVLRECDDYVANPTPSGYQSLHTAVTDACGIPLEVQIRTSSMHEVAEYGPAAHWAYKARGANAAAAEHTIQVGMPVMRSDGGKLQLGVVLGSKREARELQVAVKTGSRLLPGAQVSALDCRDLMQYCEARDWDQAGEGDWNVRVEQYLLLADGKYHAVDFYSRRQPVTATPIYGWKNGFFAPDDPAAQAGSLPGPPQSRTDAHYQSIHAEYLAESGRLSKQAPLTAQLPHLKSTPRAGIPVAPRPASPKAAAEGQGLRPAGRPDKLQPAPSRRRTDPDKIRALRRRLENAPSSLGAAFASKEAEAAPKDISIFMWPAHRIVHLPEGTTAGHVIRTQGAGAAQQALASSDSNLVNVNNQLVPASTQLHNGDYLVCSSELLNINRHSSQD